MSGLQLAILFSAVVGLMIGVFGLMVAVREWRHGSAWWAWVLPGTFGVLLIVIGLLKLVGVAA